MALSLSVSQREQQRAFETKIRKQRDRDSTMSEIKDYVFVDDDLEATKAAQAEFDAKSPDERKADIDKFWRSLEIQHEPLITLRTKLLVASVTPSISIEPESRSSWTKRQATKQTWLSRSDSTRRRHRKTRKSTIYRLRRP